MPRISADAKDNWYEDAKDLATQADVPTEISTGEAGANHSDCITKNDWRPRLIQLFVYLDGFLQK